MLHCNEDVQEVKAKLLRLNEAGGIRVGFTHISPTDPYTLFKSRQQVSVMTWL